MKKNLLPITLICTVLDEEKTLAALLAAIAEQTKLPVEVVLVDGGSSDTTFKLLQSAVGAFPTKLLVAQKKGNRSVGRNYAVELSSQELIACTDAGCIPAESWLEKLYEKYSITGCPVIAGYYCGVAQTPFELAVIPYTLIMPKNLNEETFLPATRSMLFEKSVWEKLKGFDEHLNDNEDYAFARTIQRQNIKISFAKDAVVAWQPRPTLRDFYWMIFRFARGDIQAKIIRPKVVIIFGRYFLGILLLLFILQKSPMAAMLFLVFTTISYSIWAIQKNIQFVPKGWYWLPVLQITSDVAVQHGSLMGLFKIIKQI